MELIDIKKLLLSDRLKTFVKEKSLLKERGSYAADVNHIRIEFNDIINNNKDLCPSLSERVRSEAILNHIKLLLILSNQKEIDDFYLRLVEEGVLKMAAKDNTPLSKIIHPVVFGVIPYGKGLKNDSMGVDVSSLRSFREQKERDIREIKSIAIDLHNKLNTLNTRFGEYTEHMFEKSILGEKERCGNRFDKVKIDYSRLRSILLGKIKGLYNRMTTLSEEIDNIKEIERLYDYSERFLSDRLREVKSEIDHYRGVLKRFNDDKDKIALINTESLNNVKKIDMSDSRLNILTSELESYEEANTDLSGRSSRLKMRIIEKREEHSRIERYLDNDIKQPSDYSMLRGELLTARKLLYEDKNDIALFLKESNHSKDSQEELLLELEEEEKKRDIFINEHIANIEMMEGYIGKLEDDTTVLNSSLIDIRIELSMVLEMLDSSCVDGSKLYKDILVVNSEIISLKDDFLYIYNDIPAMKECVKQERLRADEYQKDRMSFSARCRENYKRLISCLIDKEEIESLLTENFQIVDKLDRLKMDMHIEKELLHNIS
ncbi:MAG: hypothetical protein ACC630_01920 [Nitrospinota bacterium]